MPDPDFPQQSWLSFIFQALGVKFTLLLPLAALVAFVLTLILVLRGRGSAVGPALLFIAPLPFLVGIYGFVDGCINAFQVVAMLSEAPRQTEWAAGLSEALVTIWVGILLSVPSWFVAVIGLLVRSFSGNQRELS